MMSITIDVVSVSLGIAIRAHASASTFDDGEIRRRDLPGNAGILLSLQDYSGSTCIIRIPSHLASGLAATIESLLQDSMRASEDHG